MMLKKAWGEVTEQTIRNCFQKSGIHWKLGKVLWMTMMTHTKGYLGDGEDNSAVDELHKSSW